MEDEGYFWDGYEASAYFGRRHPLFTAEYVERVLQSVFHTITIIAVYEIVKETYRRIELIRLRCLVRKYEALAQACCLQVYGCRACQCCSQLNFPTITYRYTQCNVCWLGLRTSAIQYFVYDCNLAKYSRAVPTSVYRALEGKTRLWRKHPSGSPHYTVAKCQRRCSTQDEITCMNQYIRELTMYVQELKSEQEFQLKERYRRDELRRKQMAQELMLATLREKNLCACGIDMRLNEPPRFSSPPQSRAQSCNRPARTVC